MNMDESFDDLIRNPSMINVQSLEISNVNSAQSGLSAFAFEEDALSNPFADLQSLGTPSNLQDNDSIAGNVLSMGVFFYC
jgi:hypothetical protein